MVDEDHGHHEVGDYDGDKDGVVLVDKVDTLEVSISKGDRRETLWRWCIDIVDINVPNGMEVVLARLARLSFVGESAPNGVDQPSYFLGGFLFLWGLSFASWLIVSLFSSIFYYVSSSVSIVIHVLILFLSFGSSSCLVVVW